MAGWSRARPVIPVLVVLFFLAGVAGLTILIATTVIWPDDDQW